MEKFRIDFKKENGPKYIQLYKHIKNLIENSKIEASEKLPPLREMSAFLNINISTSVKAYDLLEKEKYIYKKEGSGSYIYPQASTSKEVLKAVRFDLANPQANMFPVDKFKEAVAIAIEKEGETLFDYHEGLGYEPLRMSLCDYMKSLSIESEPDRIQIISGAQQGINIIVNSILNYGDVVFIEEPSYPGAIDVFKEHGVKVVGIPVLDDGIDIGILKLKLEKIKPSILYTMPNYQNPTGVCYSEKKKKEILNLAKQFDFMIIEDDYMSDFDFNNTKIKPLRAYDEENRVIYIKSFSKILMPGLRIGFMEMPIHVRNVISRIKYSMDISTSSFTQLSLYYYMTFFGWRNHLGIIKKVYESRFKIAKKYIDSNFSDILTFRKASGGVNFFAALPKDYSSIDLKIFLESKGVKILEGPLFYYNIKAENEFRISIAHMQENDIENNLNTLKNGIIEFLSDEKNKMKYKIPN